MLRERTYISTNTVPSPEAELEHVSVHVGRALAEPAVWVEGVGVVAEDGFVVVHGRGADCHPISFEDEFARDFFAAARDVAREWEANARVQAHAFLAAGYEVGQLDGLSVSHVGTAKTAGSLGVVDFVHEFFVDGGVLHDSVCDGPHRYRCCVASRSAGCY